jgi:hypothetical protein
MSIQVRYISPTKHFSPGQVAMTAGVASDSYESPQFAAEIILCLNRHLKCDWGDLDAQDKAENELSLEQGFRLLSAYQTCKGKIFLITEADRSSTCILFTHEYSSLDS